MTKFSKTDAIVNLLRLSLIVAMGISVAYLSWYNLFLSALTLALTFLPKAVERRYRIEIPLDFEVAAILFVYAGLFLGEINNFYFRFWWWDKLLHTVSAVAFACVGFVILYIAFQARKVDIRPIWMAVFAFCFSVTIGTVWEIYEFFMDQTFGLNMQKSGLVDTMWDLISDCVGAAVAAFAGWAYMKGSRRSYLVRLIDAFIRENQPGANGPTA